MPSTFSTLKIQLMATGENNTTWGDVTNLNLGTALEEAIVGSADVTFASADVTLTLTDTNASQTARNMRLRCTGTTGGSTRNLIVPAIEKPYIVSNDCADSIIVKNTTGTGITVPAGKTMWVYNNATNVVDAVTHLSSLTLGAALPVLSGGTGTNTAFTAGSVVFAGASGVYSQDNANLFWDNANDRLGIGTASPSSKLDIGSGDLRFSSTGQRILGNTSSGTLANRLAFQSSTLNTSTGVHAIPNGSSVISGFRAESDSAFTNGQFASMDVNGGTDVRITSGIRGSGTYVPLTFYTNGAESMRIDTSGNVGIGTSSPGAKLTVNDANGIPVRIGDISAAPVSQTAVYVGVSTSALSGGNGDLVLIPRTSDARSVLFYTGNGTAAERMRIDSSGNVGIGTSSPSYKLDIGGFAAATQTERIAAAAGYDSQLKLMEAADTYGFTIRNANGSGLNFLRHSADATGATAMFIGRDTGNVGIGTSSPGQKLDVLGSNGTGFAGISARNSNGNVGIGGIQFGSDATYSKAAIGLLRESANGVGSLVFYNASSTGAANWATSDERMRIDASGNLLVGTTAVNGDGISLKPGASAGSTSQINFDRPASSTVGYPIVFQNGGTDVGYISHDNTTTTYATSSDVRLKHDIVDAPEASSLIDAIQVRSFKWNADNSEQRYGFVAQELVTVAPEAVSQPEDPEEMMGVDYGKLVPMLVKEIQSLRARVAQLEGN